MTLWRWSHAVLLQVFPALGAFWGYMVCRHSTSKTLRVLLGKGHLHALAALHNLLLLGHWLLVRVLLDSDLMIRAKVTRVLS